MKFKKGEIKIIRKAGKDYLSISDSAWAKFIILTNTKSKTESGQRKAIRKFINKALTYYLYKEEA